MLRNKNAQLICIFILLTIISTLVFSETLMEERPYEAIILYASSFPEVVRETDLSNINILKYDSTFGSWSPVPFQIDEIVRTQLPGDENPNNFYIETDTTVSFDNDRHGTDELVLMVRDLGDPAPDNEWPDDTEAKSNPRIKLRFWDPLNQVTDGYAYLFLSSSLPTNSSNPYEFSYDLTSDVVQTKYYSVGLNEKHGLVDDITIKPPFGTGTDIIDMQKLRFEGLFIMGQFLNYTPGSNGMNTFNEEAYLILSKPSDGDKYYRKSTENPAVRLIRQVRQFVIVYDISFYLKTKFYPFGGEVGVNVFLHPDSLANEENEEIYAFAMDMARMSLDFNANATGMTFNNEYNSNIAIDGTMDIPITTINTDSIITAWSLVTGTQGSLLSYFSISDTSWKDIWLYYYDNKNGGNADSSVITFPAPGNNDTGDDISYGDNGLLVRNSGANYIDLNMKMVFYMLPNTYTKNDAQKLVQQIENPVKFQRTVESYTSVKPSPTNDMKKSYQFYQNYPNPFNAETVIRYQLLKPNIVQLKVYDSNGRHIQTLVDRHQNPGNYKIAFHGDNLNSGIYIYQIWVGSSQSGWHKMLLLK